MDVACAPYRTQSLGWGILATPALGEKPRCVKLRRETTPWPSLRRHWPGCLRHGTKPLSRDIGLLDAVHLYLRSNVQLRGGAAAGGPSSCCMSADSPAQHQRRWKRPGQASGKRRPRKSLTSPDSERATNEEEQSTPRQADTTRKSPSGSAAVAVKSQPPTATTESTIPQCSREFIELCRVQFEVLASVLGVTRCALCVRREAPDGALEFVPLCVYPESQCVWVVGAAPGSRPPVGPAALPGGVAAGRLLPEYPFIDLNADTAMPLTDGGLSAPLLDGNTVLGILVVWRDQGTDSTPKPRILPEEPSHWTMDERVRLVSIAKTLALALVLDQRHRHKASGASQASTRAVVSSSPTNDGDMQEVGSRCEPRASAEAPPHSHADPLAPASAREPKAPTGERTSLKRNRRKRTENSAQLPASETLAHWVDTRVLSSYERQTWGSAQARESAMIAQIRDVLSNILHQAKSPITALRTFGKLLLRRLPPGDVNRDLARDIIVQCERLNELLSPLDTVTLQVAQLPPAKDIDRVSPAAASKNARPWPRSMPHPTTTTTTTTTTAATYALPGRMLPPPPRSLLLPAPGTNAQDAVVTPSNTNDDDDDDELLHSRSSALENGRLHLCWMNDIVRPLLGTATALAMEHGVELRARLDQVPAILADAFALREAISNVLENAIKYTGTVQPGARGRLVLLWFQLVSLSAGRDRSTGEITELRPLEAVPGGTFDAEEPQAHDDLAVALFVGDTGPGIPRGELERIWERGYRGRRARQDSAAERASLEAGSAGAENRENSPISLPSTSRRMQSGASDTDSAQHGLGLYLTRQLVERMGGMVILQSPWPQSERARSPPGISGTTNDAQWATHILPQNAPPLEEMHVYVNAPAADSTTRTGQRANRRGTLVGIVFQRAISAGTPAS
jgi:signal transduction histidine kinase